MAVIIILAVFVILLLCSSDGNTANQSCDDNFLMSNTNGLNDDDISRSLFAEDDSLMYATDDFSDTAEDMFSDF